MQQTTKAHGAIVLSDDLLDKIVNLSMDMIRSGYLNHTLMVQHNGDENH